MGRIIFPTPKNPGDKESIKEEEKLENLSFNVYKFGNRPKPSNKDDVVIICCFSEFGCETLTALYCIDRIKNRYPGRYVILAGWYGRDYFYKHQVDEFWELKEEHQWLREYCRAFHHESKNLKKLESSFNDKGIVITSVQLADYVMGNRCKQCSSFFADAMKLDKCSKCGGELETSLFGHILDHKPNIRRMPIPSEGMMAKAKSYLKPNSVGIFARGRKCYGRNLQPEFYVKLISLLKTMGYNPVWMGEKVSSLKCPVDNITNFSEMEESRNLEFTLAITAQLKFTIQFWTASTRLASMMGTPYILFESPDQIYGNGHEGFRRALCDLGPSKLVVSHFRDIYDDNNRGIVLAKRVINEIMLNNYDDVCDTEEMWRIAVGRKRSFMEKITGIKYVGDIINTIKSGE